MTSAIPHRIDADLLPDPFELKLNPLWLGFLAASMATAGALQVYDHAIKNADLANHLCNDYKQQLSSSQDFAKAANLPIFEKNNATITIALPKQVEADLPWETSSCVIPLQELNR